MDLTATHHLPAHHQTVTRRPVASARPRTRTANAVRVGLALIVGLASLGLVRVAAATVGRHPAGLGLLGRFGAGLAARAGLTGAVLTAGRSLRRVPAYRRAAAGTHPFAAALDAGDLRAFLAALPVLDKAGYVDRHPLAERCLDGRLPTRGVEIDESSGSSGRPYQWVRSRAELDAVERTMAVQAAHLLAGRRHERVVVLNCFSMGAWATGQAVTGSLRRLGAVKSCGPDAGKALAAIELLGPDACYVVAGYPPFLLTLLDTARERGVELAGLELRGFVGGEAMTEALRGRLEPVFTRVVSAYGASDLDIGVAGETELSIAVRQAAAAHPDLAEALFGHTGRLPMVFQYDPSTYHVETVPGGHGPELAVTVTRRLLSPRVRYAVHDAGGTLDFAQACAIARRHGVDLPIRGAARMPLLFVSGRADSTLSHLGANLYPEDVDAALGTLAVRRPDLRIGSFCLALAEQDDGTTTPVVHVEVGEAAARRDVAVTETVRAALAGWLTAHNRDWAAAADEDPRALAFDVRTTEPGTGVFADNATRIKRRYVLS